MNPKGIFSFFNPETAGETRRFISFEQNPVVSIAYRRMNIVDQATANMSAHAEYVESAQQSTENLPKFSQEMSHDAVKTVVNQPEESTVVNDSPTNEVKPELTPVEIARQRVAAVTNEIETGENDPRLALGA